MLLLTTNDFTGAIVKDILRTEDGLGIVWTEWTHTFEIIEELRGNVLEVDDGMNVKIRTRLLWINVLMHVCLESSAELIHILHLHRQACRIGVTTKVVEQILTTLNGSVHIKTTHTSSTSCHDITIQGEHHCWTEELLRESRSHDANNALVPVGIVNHDGTLVLHLWQLRHNLARLFRHAFVQFLALLIIMIDGLRHLQRFVIVTFNEQIHRFLTILNTSAGIDAWTYLEDDVAHRQVLTRQSTHFHHSFHTHTGIVVQLLQTMISHDAILSHDGHNVTGNADGTKVKQRNQPTERDAVTDRESLHELEAHATTRQIKIRICIVHPFGIQNRHSRRQHFVRHMVVADDKVDALVLGILNFIYRLDATIQHDHQFHTLALRIIHSLNRYTIPFLTAVRDIAFHIGVELRNKPINQSHCRASIHIVVTINHDALTLPHRLVQPLHRLVHILHQIWIMQLQQLWMEKLTCLISRAYAARHKHLCNGRVDSHFFCQPFGTCLVFGCRWFVIPSVIHYMLSFFRIYLVSSPLFIPLQQHFPTPSNRPFSTLKSFYQHLLIQFTM